MPAHVVFDVEIRDSQRFQEFMTGAERALRTVGAKYASRDARSGARVSAVEGA
jgi:uncharacterized protein (DUF1330 family)